MAYKSPPPLPPFNVALAWMPTEGYSSCVIKNDTEKMEEDNHHSFNDI